MNNFILFDLDGTITDSGEGIKNAIRYSIRKLRLKDQSDEVLNTFIGPPLSDSYKRVFSLNDEEAKEAVDTYRVYYSDKGKFENRLYDGIEDVFKKLKKDNNHLLVATSKPEVFAIEILKHFDVFKYFDHVTGATLDGKISHKTDVIRHCLDSYDCDISKTYMVGDRNYDINGGKFWGLKTIGVSYGFGDRKELEEAHADYVVDSPIEILDIFK